MLNFQIRLPAGADAAAFERAVLSEVFPAAGAPDGPLRCALYRAGEIDVWTRRRWGSLSGLYECLVEAHDDRPDDESARGGLWGLHTPLTALGADTDRARVWTASGTVPAAAPEAPGAYAVILLLRLDFGNDDAAFERTLAATLDGLVADRSPAGQAFTTARWYRDTFAEHGCWDYLCAVSGDVPGPVVPDAARDRLTEAGAQLLDATAYDHLTPAAERPRSTSGRG